MPTVLGKQKNNLKCKMVFRHCSILVTDSDFNGTSEVGSRFLSDTLKATFHSMTKDIETRVLHSASSHKLSVRHATLTTYDDQPFLVATVQVRNSLPQHVISATSLFVVCSCLKSKFILLVTHNFCVMPAK